MTIQDNSPCDLFAFHEIYLRSHNTMYPHPLYFTFTQRAIDPLNKYFVISKKT